MFKTLDDLIVYLQNDEHIILEHITKETTIHSLYGTKTIVFAPLHLHTAKLEAFSTEYNVMDTKGYYCQQEDKTYLTIKHI